MAHCTLLSVDDFLAEKTSVTFAEGETEGSVSIRILDDDVAEAQESFVAVITGEDTIGNFCAQLVNIVDNDGKSLTEWVE